MSSKQSSGRPSAICYLLSAISIFLLTCERPGSQDLLVQGFIYHITYPDNTSGFYQMYLACDVDGLPQVPVVKVNDNPIEMTDFQPQQGQYESWDVFPVDTTFDIKIQHYWGEAHSRVNMPGNTRLTEPNLGFVQGMGDPVTISWLKARGASSYWVDLYISYEIQRFFRRIRSTGNKSWIRFSRTRRLRFPGPGCFRRK